MALLETETDVVICGAGPSGLLLSANLSRLGVKHVLLEREAGITTDPRGIVLDEDGIRSLQGVGVYEKIFTEIGKELGIFQFIEGGKGLNSTPFLRFDQNMIVGGTGHPGFISHKQPSLEKCLREVCDPNFGDFRSESTVTRIEEDEENVFVRYKSSTGTEEVVKTKFLVGADGKTGFVRKKYLEPRGVMLEKSDKFNYEAVWVAMNWRLTLPNPQSHPDLPFWSLGYSPEEVYDLSFPRNFNFICDPDRPSVCGRFGKTEDRLWRFEFVVKDSEDGEFMASQEQTRKIVMPYLTRNGARFGISRDISWPLDCIECIRSRPFSFSARSCNIWALGRVILCGDAAHVFPPFGGQGIASGFRDALSLSWRLKVATLPFPSQVYHEALLKGWYKERKQQLERSLAATIANGDFCNEPSRIKSFVRNWYLWLIQLVPSWRHDLEMGPRKGGMTRYHWEPEMPFLPASGGKSFPQVFSAPIDGPAPSVPSFTDDTIFRKDKRNVFQTVALLDSPTQLTDTAAEIAQLELVEGLMNPSEATYIVHGNTPPISTTEFCVPKNGNATHIENVTGNIVRVLGAEEYTAAGLTDKARKLEYKRLPPLFYDPNRIRKDLGFDIRYVIVRWDRFVFASCKDIDELRQAVTQLESSLRGSVNA